MRRFLALIALLSIAPLFGQIPHGDTFEVECTNCHNVDSWVVTESEMTFDHDTTAFKREGQHTLVSCRSCHTSLQFEQAQTECSSCHTDMHQSTLGNECGRCHTPVSWLVSNVAQIHYEGRFPLEGNHLMAACADCHVSSSTLKFEPVGILCFDCHSADYAAAQSPNHVQGNFSTECSDCHDPASPSWSASNVDHNFFPLAGGHSLSCSECHESGTFTGLSQVCYTCHQPTYQGTQNPPHAVLNFPTECNQCHTLNPGWSPATFTVHDQYFALTGAHTAAECAQCHTGGVYTGTPNECVGCHQTDYNNTTNPNHQALTFPTACDQCHTTAAGWSPAAFTIHDQYFALTGVHASTDCAQCHPGGVYTGTPNTCVGCHQSDYNNTTNPNHQTAGFGIDCAGCHTPTGWTPAEFDHDVQYFPIYSGKHNNQWNACSDCHTNSASYADFSCITCHDHNQTEMDQKHTSVQGYQYASSACLSCHPDGSSEGAFNHSTSAFPLTGAHVNTDCALCHTSGYPNTPTECFACHQTNYNASVNPNHQQLALSTDCQTCHTTNPGWEPAAFAVHDTYYALTGAHSTISGECLTCHNGNYTTTPNECSGCHSADYNASTNPNHQALTFPTTCDQCHTTNPGWSPATFTIHDQYFALTGAHTAAECAQCHPGGVYTGTPNECAGCHQTDYNNTTNPNHQALTFPTTCDQCHTTAAGWSPATFTIHDQYFALTGAHTATECAQCHPGGVYTGTPNECAGCHQTDYNNTTNPNHQALTFPTTCDQCHTTNTGWSPATFTIHDQYFELTGVHLTTDCAQCHPGGVYTGTPNTCIGCHQTDYDNTTNPNHQTAGFGIDCAGCHTPSGWTPAEFDHDAQYFPIYSGKHNNQWNACADCHTNPASYADFSCTNCHDHNQADTDQQHASVQGYQYNSQACFSCHPDGNAEGAFNHATSIFPLTGAHLTTECALCHTNGYPNTPTECSACHQTDYNTSINPNHQTLALSIECQTCHTTNPGWEPATFAVHNNYYALTGAHAAISGDCVTCHNGNYTTTPNECSGCHTADYNSSTNPNHQVLEIPTTCADCHTTNPGWSPATFGIHDQYFVLAGAHTTATCVQCHANGVYTGTPNTCVGCHQTDYNNTTNPNHQAAGFGTDCAACHTSIAWSPADFDHDVQYFPIYSGSHNNEWTSCADCHPNPASYSNFSCITCHDHSQATMDQQHAGVQGYQYNSESCFACHPDGNAEGAFNHSTSIFPLTGAHLNTACALCHTNGYPNTPTECAACHQTDYNTSINPNHQTLGLSTDCQTCHTTNPDWQPATFGVHNNFYALTGAHAAIAGDCVTCHNGNYNNTPSQCSGCHTADYNASTNPDHQVLEIPTTCADCHTTNPGWAPATFGIHDQYFVLAGAHTTATCAQCHTNGVYTGTPNTCVGCHQTDYNNTTNPNHQAAGFGTDCATCHTSIAWTPADFDHDLQYFPIYSGAHRNEWTTCADCHTNPADYAVFSCITCHDHNQASMNAEHTNVQGYQYNSEACFACHPNGTAAGAFNHATSTFPLTGAHLTTECALCHTNGYPNTPNTCSACHQNDYNTSVNPNHQSLGLSFDCQTCHTTNPDWQPATFGVHNNYYALTGAHAAIAAQCATCHNGNYTNTPNACSGCHQSDFNTSLNPNHQTLGLSTDCQTCHTTSPDWQPATFGVHNNYYALTGAHATIAGNCFGCHSGNYNNTPNICSGCHTADYNATTNPDHEVLAIPLTCADCHTTNPGWTPATFAIHEQYYVIAGAHTSLSCAQCHIGGVYTGTPNTCYGCHQADFNQATNPNHQAAGFPTDCLACHTQVAWDPANFNHDGLYFPIYSGRHNGEWNTCADCHQNPANFQQFECIFCHEHNRTSTDNDHRGVQNYQYNSAACYDCHPNGNSKKRPFEQEKEDFQF